MSKSTLKDPLIQDILEKYKFVFPVPKKIQKKGLVLRKKTLAAILKKSAKKSLFTSAIVSVYYWFKHHGFDVSLRKSAQLFYASATTCVIVIAVASGLAINTTLFHAPQLPFGMVTFTEGNVYIQKNDASMVPLTSKSAIKVGDLIKTSNNSAITIQLTSKDVIRLLPNSAMSIKKDPKQASHTTVELAYGSVFSNINHNNNRTYKVKTPLWTITVRGTQFMTYHNKNESSVELLKGTIEIHSLKNPEKRIPLTKNKAAKINDSYIVNIYSLPATDVLRLQKSALYFYINKFESLNNTEIKRILESIKKEEKKIDSKIRPTSVEWDTLNPLDKLRKMGKPITMIHLSNNTKIAGYVVSQTGETIIVDTGAGVLNIPHKKIVRKIPIQ